MKQWISDYIKAQKAAHDSIPVDALAQLIEQLRADRCCGRERDGSDAGSKRSDFHEFPPIEAPLPHYGRGRDQCGASGG